MNWPKRFFGLLLLLLSLSLFGPSSAQDKSTGDQADPLPTGAGKRFGTTRLRHGSRILCLAFSPNGKKLAAGGGNDPVRVWDTETGQEIVQMKEAWVQAIGFAPPRGATLVTAGAFRKIRTWEVISGKVDKDLPEEHKSPIRALVISSTADGGLIVSGGQDGKVVAWEYPTYKKLAVLEDHKEEITALGLSPDSSRLATASGDRSVRVWDTDSFKMIRRFDLGCLPTCVAFSGDGKTLLVGGDDNLMRHWEVGTGQALPTWKGHDGPLVSLVMSRDGATLASGAQDGTMRLWDVAARKEKKSFTRDPGDSDTLALSNDGKLLATAGLNNTVRLFDTESGKELLANLGPRSPLTAAVLSHDGKLLAAGGTARSIHLWDTLTGKETRQLPSDHQGELALAIAPDDKTLAAAGGAGAITLWNLPAGDQGQSIAGAAKDPILTLRYSPDGKQLASGHRTGMVRIWNLADKKLVHELKYPGAVYALAFAHDGKTIAASGNSKVLIWDLVSGQEIRRFASKEGPTPTQPHVSSLAFSPDGTTLALGCYDAVARLFDLRSGKEVRACEGHRSAVLAVAFSADGRALATGSFDQTARIFEAPSGQQVAAFSGHQGPVNSVMFAGKGRGLYSAAADTSILTWDITGLGHDGALPMMTMTLPELQTAWSDLASEDAPRAYRSLWRLAAAAPDSVPFLGKQITLVDPKLIKQHFVDLNNNKYEVRNKATLELSKYEVRLKTRLLEAIKNPPGEEVRRRVEKLLDKLNDKLNVPGTLTDKQEDLRDHRVMLILEQVGSAPAKEILQQLAAGAFQEFLQHEAQRSLERLGRAH